ncbi:MAG: 4'-phosphopantetheinyl transferase superfamily protein, partial [Verrucomicrobiales bacterium]|nr:4'-phosphopantetheinyl transferase superfamily protein [Verrucomicrobiales bacterium]
EDRFAACESVLSEEERLRADSFHFEKDRRQYVVARGSLRHLLGSLLSIEAGAVEFAYGSFGKPFLKAEAGAGGAYRFNLAHSGTHILIGVSPNLEIGVDLEALSPGDVRMAPLIRNICTPNEAAWVKELDGQAKELALSRLWTAKEAILKAIGSGFQIPPDQVEIVEPVLQGLRGSYRTRILAKQNRKVVDVFPMPEFESERGCSASFAIAGAAVDRGSVPVDRRGALWD